MGRKKAVVTDAGNTEQTPVKADPPVEQVTPSIPPVVPPVRIDPPKVELKGRMYRPLSVPQGILDVIMNGADLFKIADGLANKAFPQAVLVFDEQGTVRTAMTNDAQVDNMFMHFNKSDIVVTSRGALIISPEKVVSKFSDLPRMGKVRIQAGTGIRTTIQSVEQSMYSLGISSPDIATVKYTDISPPLVGSDDTWYSPTYDESGKKIANITTPTPCALLVKFTRQQMGEAFKTMRDSETDYLELDFTGAIPMVRSGHLGAVSGYPISRPIQCEIIRRAATKLVIRNVESLLKPIGDIVMLNWHTNSKSVIFTGQNEYGFFLLSRRFVAQGE